jgi:hypothetical protein
MAAIFPAFPRVLGSFGFRATSKRLPSAVLSCSRARGRMYPILGILSRRGAIDRRTGSRSTPCQVVMSVCPPRFARPGRVGNRPGAYAEMIKPRLAINPGLEPRVRPRGARLTIRSRARTGPRRRRLPCSQLSNGTPIRLAKATSDSSSLGWTPRAQAAPRAWHRRLPRVPDRHPDRQRVRPLGISVSSLPPPAARFTPL